ncbi:MAG: DPP IV N-terminal domain-containing protein [Planctomycetota bacterium]|nr:DPP IV N-terminal domain-containing protein [Planctomycetota bacterium]
MKPAARFLLAFLAAISCLPVLLFSEEPVEQLTRDGLLKRDPCYLPGAGGIVFATRHRSPRMVLMQLELESGKLSRVNPKSNLVEMAPSYSANGSLFCFQRLTGNDETAFVIQQGEPASQRQLVGSRKVNWNVQVSPRGDEVAYNLSGQIYLRSLKTDKETKLTDSAGRNDWPSISPDGKQVVFSSSRDGNYDLYVIQRESSRVRRLTTTEGLDMRPRWSPDGSQVLFTSNRDGNYEIYMVGADGSGLQRLTDHGEQDDYACWHPQGGQIAWIREEQGRFDLVRMSLPKNAN